MIPLKDTVPARSAPIVNVVLILLNVCIFIYEYQLGPALEPFVRSWGVVPVQFVADPAAEWPTLFSSMFLHGGWFHLISNMWALWIFGDNVEDRLGSVTYLAFYLMAGLVAALAHVVFNPGSILPTVGASGAIAGVLGAYLVLYPRARVVSLLPLFIFFTVVEVPAFLYLGFWFVSQLFNGFAMLAFADTMQNVGGVAWWAHAGGFMVGLLAAPFFRLRPNQRPWPDQYYPY